MLGAQSVIPPFSATALLAGDSHIVTFDQMYYDFASQGCSYLLASDFSNGKFSAIANYDEEMSRTSIGEYSACLLDALMNVLYLYFHFFTDVISDGRTINIDTKMVDDGLIKVTLDKRNAQLPMKFDHTYVYRQDNTVIVENTEGLRVTCNAVFNVCTFTISGWYFGKTGGLLGIYDNEPSNDWMNPEREVTSDLEDFVSSWVLNKDKRCSVEVSQDMTPRTSEELDACSYIFESEDSPLMPCFKTIDPRPFNRMCLRDMDSFKNRPDKRNGVCPSAAAYIEQCKSSGVELWMPAQCVSCQQQDTLLKSGDTVRYQGNLPTSAVDVVFIVQQSQCLDRSHLEDLPYLIDRSFRVEGKTDTRYALVGFGGNDELERPHIFTSGSRIFNEIAKLTPSLKK